MSDPKDKTKASNKPKLPKLDTNTVNSINQSRDANKPKLHKIDTNMVRPIDRIKDDAASTNTTNSSTRSATSDPSLRGMQSQDNLARRSTEASTENKPGKSDSHHSKHRTNADSSKERSASTADGTRAANGGRTHDSAIHTSTRSHTEKPGRIAGDAEKSSQSINASRSGNDPVGRDNNRKAGSQQPTTESKSTGEMHHAKPVDSAAAFETKRKLDGLVEEIGVLREGYMRLVGVVDKLTEGIVKTQESLILLAQNARISDERLAQYIQDEIRTLQQGQPMLNPAMNGHGMTSNGPAPQYHGYQQMPPPDPYAGYSDQWVGRPENHRYH